MPRWLDKALGGTDEALNEYDKTHPSKGLLRDTFFPTIPQDQPLSSFFIDQKPDETMPASASIPGISHAQDTAQQYGDMNTVANAAGYRPNKGLVARAAARNQSSY